LKRFDLKKAKNMSQDQIQAIVCEGLAEVCEGLAKASKEIKGKQPNRIKERCPTCGRWRWITRIKTKKIDYSDSFLKRAKVFRTFAKIHQIKHNMEVKNGTKRNNK